MSKQRSAAGVACVILFIAFGSVGCSGEADTNPADPTSPIEPQGNDMATGQADATTSPGEDSGRSDATSSGRDMTRDESTDDMARADVPEPRDMGMSDGGDNSRLPVFVAQGRMGRTTMSCDDGLTWVADRDFDSDAHPLNCGETQGARCGGDGSCRYWHQEQCYQKSPDSCDCSHHPGAPQGIAFGDGAFVATYGWGPKGGVFRSVDGQNWEMVIEDTTFAGLQFGQGAFVLGSGEPHVSRDAGLTWKSVGRIRMETSSGEKVGNIRSLGFADIMGGRFILTGATGDKKGILISKDGGMSWERPETIDDSCGSGTQGVLVGHGKVVIIGLERPGGQKQSFTCVSSDGGDTWMRHELPESVSGAIFDSTQFWTWSGDNAYHSDDGATWTAEELVGVRQSDPNEAVDVNISAVERHPQTGTLVAVSGRYEDQQFLRSQDGIRWEALNLESFDASHRVTDIAAGWLPAGTACPSR